MLRPEFSTTRPLCSEHPYSLEFRAVVRPWVGVGHTSHRENLLGLAKRFVRQQEWHCAAEVAALLLELASSEFVDTERKRKRYNTSKIPMSTHSRETLVDVWKAVIEIARQFPDSFSFNILSNFTRLVYSLIRQARLRTDVVNGLIDLHLVNDDPGRTFAIVQQMRGGSICIGHDLLLGLIVYQKWRNCMSVRGPEFALDVNELMSCPVEMVRYTPELQSDRAERWDRSTSDLHREAMRFLMRYFDVQEPMDLTLEADVLSRLFHLHLAVNDLGTLLSATQDKRDRGRRKMPHKPYLVKLELLMCLILDNKAVFSSMLQLAEDAPSSPIPLRALRIVEEKIETKRMERLDQTEWKSSVLLEGTKLAFIHLDVCSTSEAAWRRLATHLDEIKRTDKRDGAGFLEVANISQVEVLAEINGLWSERASWWKRCQFNVDVFTKELSSKKPREYLEWKVICSLYLDYSGAMELVFLLRDMHHSGKGATGTSSEILKRATEYFESRHKNPRGVVRETRPSLWEGDDAEQVTFTFDFTV
ncbi:hypothetical protein HOP50_07g47910 [Chloropicon primus]|uniref:Uncharacterized protein n=1 Tax=Chloropicon primus TaxID=1764295 RepID=A0A5B8MPJ5_9CHLO|nr:hypothetical protein A3770_07p47690 [Chloropicon primus]UPR01469.1 hypothetical protein HOP50_07g47910 [Chloropicon primus]|mmetsp:Transcript_2814/g.7707  ORF Transcript_2814/g.7707 Transcript_2814/m.7707 type:complete len:532 (-) Transcript_2814:32-1627(-)|eukprot:QDZ22251.1 hypothetical protein A3770_07p47690 [Chloropicon primus]